MTPRQSTRQRILVEAMRLFGENGYSATQTSAIEEAVGLSPGSGGLYKHFRSKAEVLAEGVSWQLATGSDLYARLEGDEPAGEPVSQRLAGVVFTGLRRLEQEGDLNRLIVQDLRQFPDLMEQVREREMQRISVAVAQWLARQAGPGIERDWRALATVLTGAVANYWLLQDAFGGHPSGVTEEEFAAAAAELLTAVLAEGGERA